MKLFQLIKLKSFSSAMPLHITSPIKHHLLPESIKTKKNILNYKNIDTYRLLKPVQSNVMPPLTLQYEYVKKRGQCLTYNLPSQLYNAPLPVFTWLLPSIMRTLKRRNITFITFNNRNHVRYEFLNKCFKCRKKK